MSLRRTVSLAPNWREWHHHAIRHGQYTQTHSQHTQEHANRNMTQEKCINTFLLQFWKPVTPPPTTGLTLLVCLPSVVWSYASLPRGAFCCVLSHVSHVNQTFRQIYTPLWKHFTGLKKGSLWTLVWLLTAQTAYCYWAWIKVMLTGN